MDIHESAAENALPEAGEDALCAASPPGQEVSSTRPPDNATEFCRVQLARIAGGAVNILADPGVTPSEPSYDPASHRVLDAFRDPRWDVALLLYGDEAAVDRMGHDPSAISTFADFALLWDALAGKVKRADDEDGGEAL